MTTPQLSSVNDVVNAITSAIKPGGEVYIATVPGEGTGRILQQKLSEILGIVVDLAKGVSRYPSDFLPGGNAEIINFTIPK